MILSLTSRLLLAGSVVLAAFLSLTSYALDRAFGDSAEEALKSRLQAHAVGLIAAAEQLGEDGQLHMPGSLPESRYASPGSGLYAEVSSNNGRQRWQSPSMSGLNTALLSGLSSGADRYQRLLAADGKELYAFGLGVTWDLSEEASEGYTFSVAEDMAGYYAQVSDFRGRLLGWLGSAALVLLAVMGGVLRWSLAPMREVATDLSGIEAGQQHQLEGRYPKEMRTLTDNINALLISQRDHLERYRHTLSDLAHSLKTPLAVLRGSLGNPSCEGLNDVISEQVQRMNEIVDYQLQRAATSGRFPLAAPVAVSRIATKMQASLNKVYADKHVQCHLNAAEGVLFHGDEGDLLELLGNLMDNAYKWSRQQVAVSARVVPGETHPELELQVEDDGPGIDAALAREALQRGVRHDPATPGHGIGLAIVQDIVQLYDGKLTLGRSRWNGARITVSLPST